MDIVYDVNRSFHTACSITGFHCISHLESSSAPNPSATGRSRWPSAIANARNSHWAPIHGSPPHKAVAPLHAVGPAINAAWHSLGFGDRLPLLPVTSWPSPSPAVGTSSSEYQVPLPSLPPLMSLVPLTRQWFVLFSRWPKPSVRCLTKIIIIIIKCSYIHFNTKNTSMSGSRRLAAPWVLIGRE